METAWNAMAGRHGGAQDDRSCFPSGPIEKSFSRPGCPIYGLQPSPSTAPINEKCCQQTTPFVNNIIWDLPELRRGGLDDHLSWETPFRKHLGAWPGSTWNDRENVPVVAFSALSRPSRFAARVFDDVEEANDGNPRHRGARRVVAG